jgi:UV DNA damage endonuclease
MNLSESTTDSNGKLVKISAKNKIFTSRTVRMANFSMQKASELALKNVQDLVTILKWNVMHDIHMFRISSNMFPFIDHPELGYHVWELPDGKEIIETLAMAGQLARNNDIRLSCHPGPYTCIASPREDVANKSIVSIDRHAEIAGYLDTPDFCINIHVGGNYYDFYEQTALAFSCSFHRLTDNAQKLLTVENDDRASLWSVKKLYDHIHDDIGIPIVLDIHHWKFNNDLSLEDSARLALSTWGDKVPKMHYSESRPDAKPQAHSDYLTKNVPEFDFGIEYDVMLETKQKDKALLEYNERMG